LVNRSAEGIPANPKLGVRGNLSKKKEKYEKKERSHRAVDGVRETDPGQKTASKSLLGDHFPNWEK